jgi:hypothetical protein
LSLPITALRKVLMGGLSASVVALGVLVGLANVPAARATDQPPAVVPAEQAPHLQAILGQLVVMNHELQQVIAAGGTASRPCQYEERRYTQGSLLKVAGVRLVCVHATESDRDWGVDLAIEPTCDDQRYLWEPLTSSRLERYRKATGLLVPTQ